MHSFPHKERFSLSLSLNFLVDFFKIFLASLLWVDNFLYSLKLYFGLMQFSFVFFVAVVVVVGFFFIFFIVKCYPITF